MIAPMLPDDSDLRFPSLTSLRAAHGEILRRQRESSGSPELQADVETFIRRGRATGALLDENEDRWEAQSILDYWATYLFRADRRTVDATLDDFDPELAPDLNDADCPYVGLDAFRESRFEVFFGRQRMIQAMLERLATERFLAVVGSSGSGKSSVVLAGVLPVLKAGGLPGSGSWHYLPSLVPGPEPLVNLVRALSAVGTDAETVTSRAERLREDPRYILELASADGRPCVLVVDQFEELFTLCGEEPVRQAFADTLATLVQSLGLRHTVLLTMRSDYESNVAKLGSFQLLFEKAQVRVTPLSSPELRDAILRPAELVGLKFEEGVVDALLRDILGEPAGLPLLQFTLFKLWESREHNRVTWEAYRRLGGGRLALAKSADDFYRSLIPEDQVTARRILLRMVRPSEGLEVTSSRIRRADLHRAGEDPGRIDRALDRLVGAHLVRLTPGEVRDDDQFEVAHEALVRNWPTLVRWLDEERAEITMRSRLESMVKEWLLLEKRGGLLDEVQLRDAERWLASPSASLLGYHPELPALVKASREAIDEAKRKEEEARRRELEQAHQLAEAERRRAEYKARSSRIFRALTTVMAVLFLLSAWAAWWAFDSQREALAAQEEALAAQRKAFAAETQLGRLRALRAEDERDFAAMQSARNMKLRLQAENALKETEKQKGRAEKALKDLQKQKALTDAALAQANEQRRFAEEQRQRAEDALRQANLQRVKVQEALEEAQAERERTQKALREKEAALEDANAQKQRAEEALAKYQEQKQFADKAQALTAEAYKNPEISRASNRVLRRPQELKLNDRTRPLRVGASISSPEGVTGSLCCVVKDSAGRRYLLGLRSVFAGEPGAPILQPARLDGGAPDEDKVAVLTRVDQDKLKGAAIARLDPDIAVDFSIPGIGKIRGLEKTVYPGDKVRLVGHSSGILEGRVIGVNDREVITTIVPRVGDNGSAVLSDDGELVGLLYGANNQQSFVVRIVPILRELGVELVKD
jgi:hypothetical protein